MTERATNNNYKSVSSLSFTPVTLSVNLNTDFFIIKNKMEKEIWKDVKGYEGLYQVSNLGRIKSIIRKGKILSNKSHRYISVIFYKNKLRKNIRVHRLVAGAFIPNPENKPQVNHIDGNKKNNNVNNLEWNTQLENIRHAYRTGIKSNKPKQKLSTN
jgi:hypothetical protein